MAIRLILFAAMLGVAVGLPACSRSRGPDAAPAFEIEKRYDRGPVSLALKVSRKSITIADRVTLVLEATSDEGYDVELPKFGEKLEQFGIVDYRSLPPRLAEKGKVVTAKSYELEPFLSGEYKIPPMKLRFWKKGEQDKDAHELETEEQTITVTSILSDKQAELKIKEIAPPVALPAAARSWLYAAIGGGVVLIGAVALLWLRRRRKEQADAIRLPAHEIAYQELEKLLAEDLINKGELQLFYFRISDILRHYLENRFGLHAPEQTTEEFLQEIGEGTVLDPAHKSLLKEFLRHCDLVKFAKHQPNNEEIQKTFDTCKTFIEATKSEGEAVEVATDSS